MKIAVMVPTMGQMEAVLHDWLIGQAQKHSLIDLKTYGVSPVERAFNSLHARFLATDADYAFILNDDECPEPDALDRLLAHGKDIVAGVCWKWTEERGPLPVAARWENGQYVWVRGAGLEQVDRFSMSGVLVTRRVMEAVPVGTYRHQPTSWCACGWVDPEDLWGRKPCPKCGREVKRDGREFISPGFWFWDAARRMGFDLWMDFGVRIHHYKKVDLLRVNDLMALAKDEGRASVCEMVKRWRAQGVADSEIVAALV